MGTDGRDHGLVEGENIWRIAAATRATVIIDADDYFRAARTAMLAAEHRIMLIGWDFDARIALRQIDGGDTAPEMLGKFVLWLADRRPDLEIYLLRWDFGAVRALFRGLNLPTLVRWLRHPRIFFKLDGAHPLGASHHQKIVVVDDCLAFCGGIDMTVRRWDTRDHVHDSPERVGPDGKRYGPWHDATTAIEGPAAALFGELARERWAFAGGGTLAPVTTRSDCWPGSLPVQFSDVRLAIARSRPEYRDCAAVVEIEQLYLDLIARAERTIYAESQYFASRRIAEAIGRRLAEPDSPEVVMINPPQADGWLEQQAMDTARARLFQALKKIDVHDRLRIYHPFTTGGAPIYVHAKIMVIDDVVLRIGSSNMNNRSLRLDTECDVVLDATLPENAAERAAIAAVRDGLLAEHLDVEVALVEARLAETGSLIATIEALRGKGRSLRPYVVPDLNGVEEWLADHEALDPEGPEAMFEPLSDRSLLGGIRRLRARVRRPRR